MTPSTLILSADELRHLTGYKLAKAQLRVLHEMGCWMARLTPFGVSCPRAHFEAVCKGAVPGSEAPPAPEVPGLDLAALAAITQRQRSPQRVARTTTDSRART